jgi:NADPH-dependent 2,4-dienoyl-CoA reductase/sulfur reductase-like enzyme
MRYVILGGGVAGVACLEELLRAAPGADVTLVCAAPSVKAVANYLKVSDVLESFDLEELPLAALAAARPNVKPVRGVATAVDAAARLVRLADGRALPFDRLCVAAGAVPRSVVACPLVVTLRDMQSMGQLATRLAGARRQAHCATHATAACRRAARGPWLGADGAKGSLHARPLPCRGGAGRTPGRSLSCAARWPTGAGGRGPLVDVRVGRRNLCPCPVVTV